MQFPVFTFFYELLATLKNAELTLKIIGKRCDNLWDQAIKGLTGKIIF